MLHHNERPASRGDHDHGHDHSRDHGRDGRLERLTNVPDGTQLLFVGSVNCLRHRPYRQVGQMMAEGKAALLCPSMGDFSTGRYVNQIYDAIVELSQERGSKDFVLAFGCQWVILSTDADLIVEQLQQEHGIRVTLCDDSHLERGDRD